MFNQREIEQILKEDHEQYDISLVLNLEVLESDLRNEPDQRKVVSKIVPGGNSSFYVKAYCEGYLGPDNLVGIKLTGICEDSGITVVEEVLDNSMLVGICKVMIVRGVMPLNQPLKLIKSFTDFARICIFPFLTCIREGSNHSEDDGSMQDMNENAPADEGRQKAAPSSDVWNIELLGLPPGILEEDVTLKFMDNECSVALHYL